MPSVAAPAEAKPISAITRTRCVLAFVWVLLYSSFTLMTPPLLDDADSVHAEVAREMITRNDWVTLYANGIRYLEKAPLLYWSMASSFRIFGVNTGAARVPLALTVLLLAMAMEAFARLAFGSTRAGLTAGLITLSSFGIFIFTRITIPDAMVCLWITLAVFCYWLTLQRPSPSPLLCWGFAACCALNVLTKGLIGIVFPMTIVLLHLLLMDGPRGVIAAVRQLYPISSAAVFLLIATPWHVLAGEANPTEGHPGGLTFLHGHWSVPLPTPGNVHGWTWFYFMNEHVLRYLNLRVPRDYDTVPLWLFYGLVLVWLMPWSAYLWSAVREVPWIACIPWLAGARRQITDARSQTRLLLGVWAAVIMLFFSFSTRQEYYCLPALPAMILLLAGWFEEEALEAEAFRVPGRLVPAGQRISVVILAFGSVVALVCGFFVLHTQAPGASVDLASLLRQNPGDYALSFGHFLDLNAKAMGAFREPLLMTAAASFFGALGGWWARREYRPHTGNLWLAAGSIGFLLAAHVGLQTFAPVLSSEPLAEAIAPLLKPSDLLIINGEYESGSTLGFYLQQNDVHILNGRSSNLWYGSFFSDSPPIFETDVTLPVLWTGRRRVFLWTEPDKVPQKLGGPAFLIAEKGGKEILSNQASE